MFRPLGMLPLHMACLLISPQNDTVRNAGLATNAPIPKMVTELPDGYAVFREAGVALKNYKTWMQWDQARRVCAAEGGYLAVPDSFKKIENVVQVAEKAVYPWAGYHRIFDIDEWTSLGTGLPVVSLPWRYVSWDYDKGRLCTAMYLDGSGIYAAGCLETHPFVCEIPLHKN